MGSHGFFSNSNVGIQTRTQNQGPKSNPLGRQGSIYNLTLDEVQNQLGDLGKPLSSMNVDELLKAVWTIEANNRSTVGINHGPEMGPQGSVSIDLSTKTVEELWQDIQQGQERYSLDRKATLGEITLEAFLVKAGVVAESSIERDPVVAGPSPTGPVQQDQWMNMGPIFVQGHMVQGPSLPLMANLSDTQTPARKRVALDEIAEKCVERRQKRMIKNRESASRSRARKQAYTHELENKISRLEEENERLRRQKELETVLPIIPPPEPKYQLRRTNSAPI